MTSKVRRRTATALVVLGLLAGALPGAARGDEPIPNRWKGGPVNELPTHKRVVALTFDCGSANDGVRRILRTLERRGVTATFFVTGQFARRYPRDIRAIAGAGHRIGNHSDTHVDFRRLTASQQVHQLRRAQRSIEPLSGASTRPWFRFPYGGSNAGAVRQVNGQGYAAVGWTVDTLGWMGTSGGQSVSSIHRRILAGAQPGEIVMMHVGANPQDGSTLDARALPGAIRDLSERGYRFVELSQTLSR